MPRQNTSAVPNPLRTTGVVAGAMNRASSGRPASADRRSRAASRSAAAAARPTPAVASSSMPGVSGTGGENRSASVMPWVATCQT